jgi:hypothetical protein
MEKLEIKYNQFGFITNNYSFSFADNFFNIPKDITEYRIWFTKKEYITISFDTNANKLSIEFNTKFTLITIQLIDILSSSKLAFGKTEVFHMNSLLTIPQDLNILENVLSNLLFNNTTSLSLVFHDRNGYENIMNYMIWVESPWHDNYYFKNLEENRLEKLIKKQ